MFEIQDVIILLGATVVFVAALAVTARFALKPIVQSIITLRESFVSTSATSNRDQEIRQLHAEVDELRNQVDELRSQRDFDLALTPPHGDKLLGNQPGR